MRTLAWLVLSVAPLACNRPSEGLAEPDTDTSVISRDSVSAFLKELGEGDYRRSMKTGRALFREGPRISEHGEVLKGFPLEETPHGRVRYDLMRVEGDAGVAWISLFLEKDSGRIVEFSAGEASR